MNKLIYSIYAISAVLSFMFLLHNHVGSVLSLIGSGMFIVCNIIVYFWTTIDYLRMWWFTAIFFIMVSLIRMTFQV